MTANKALLDVLARSGKHPSEELLAPLWRTTRFALGDGLMFRPDIVHSTTANDGPYLRIALTVGGRDNDLPYGPENTFSLDAGRDLAETEWLLLAILAVQPMTPWLARQAFASRGIIGRLWTCQPRAIVERAFTTLSARDLIAPHQLRDPNGVWIHEYFQATSSGRDSVAEWLTTPSRRDENLLGIKLQLSHWLELDPSALLSDRPTSTTYRWL